MGFLQRMTLEFSPKGQAPVQADGVETLCQGEGTPAETLRHDRGAGPKGRSGECLVEVAQGSAV